MLALNPKIYRKVTTEDIVISGMITPVHLEVNKLKLQVLFCQRFLECTAVPRGFGGCISFFDIYVFLFKLKE